jgi:guanylate kinase
MIGFIGSNCFVTAPVLLPFSQSLLFALSGPSGCGKSTLSKLLRERDAKLATSISATTRVMRPGEIDGKDYTFLSPQTFEKWEEKGRFLETTRIFSNAYGTPRREVDMLMEQGHDILFDVDVAGAQSLYKHLPKHVVRIFIFPPSMLVLRKRLEDRGQACVGDLEIRLERASKELKLWSEFDYLLINDDLEKTFQQLAGIVIAERQRRIHQQGVENFVKHISQEIT